MSIFNPDVPNPNENTPRWGRDSLPGSFSKFEGDTSLGKLFEGVGNTLEVGAKGVDFLIKKNIDDKIWDKVNTEREVYTEALQSATDAAKAPKGSLDITAPDKQPPERIGRSINYLENIKKGVEAGKVNDTEYSIKLNAIVKDLRASYPGYREYIDQKVSSITGFDPANKTIQNLLEDINSVSGKKDELHSTTMRLLDNYVGQYQQAARMLGQLGRKEISPQQALDWMEEVKGLEIETASAKRVLDNTKTKDDVSVYNADKSYRKLRGLEVHNYVNNVAQEAGIATTDDVHTYLDKVRTGQIKPQQEQLTALGEVMLAKVSRLEREWNKQNAIPNKAGQSVNDILTRKKVREIDDEMLKDMKDLSKELLGGNYSAAVMVTRKIQDMNSDAGYAMRTDPQIKGVLDLATGASTAFGDVKILDTFLGSELMKSGQATEGIRRYVSQRLIAGAAQGVTPNLHGPVTFEGTIKHAEISKIPVPTTASMALEGIQHMVNPGIDDKAKRGWVQYFFDTKNLGVLSKFNADQQGTVFKSLTSSGVIDEAYRVTQNNPDLRGKIVNWAKHSFGKELLPTELRDLQSWKLPEGASIMFDDTNSKWKLFWQGKDITDDTSKEYKQGSTFRPSKGMQEFTNLENLIQTRDGLQRINSAWNNMIHIAKKESKDPNVWIYQMMLDEGYNPNSAVAPTSIPERMLRAISEMRRQTGVR